MSMKTLIRDSLPMKWQVPVKYWYNRMCGTLEAEMQILESLVRAGDRVIDVGGNRGVYAYKLWRLGADVDVFEPNPACVRVLKAWAARKPRARIYPVALSNRNGSANLHIPVDHDGVEHDASASIEHSAFENNRDEVVVLRTLDSCGIDQVGLIKIDVEGHEHDVIEGAAITLNSMKPALLIEIEQRHNARPMKEVFEQVAAFGYHGFFLDQGKMKELKDFSVSRDQSSDNFGKRGARYINNFVFLHRNKLADGVYANLLGPGDSK
jgi:FkbM family methyltransferase